MPIVISDTDFLSSFLKIGRLELLRAFYRVEIVWIPPRVYREMAQTELLTRLVETSWVRIAVPPVGILDTLLTDQEFRSLGAGEQESIVLTSSSADSVLMISDNKARRVATRLGVVAIHIPAFLLACKNAGLLDREELIVIVRELREKDYYEFRQDVLSALLD